MHFVCTEKIQNVFELFTVFKLLIFGSLSILAVSQSSENQRVIQLLLYWRPGSGPVYQLHVGLFTALVLFLNIFSKPTLFESLSRPIVAFLLLQS